MHCASLVFLAFCLLLPVVGLLRLVAALLWLRTVLLLLQTETFVQLLGFLEKLIEVKLSDDVLLAMTKKG